MKHPALSALFIMLICGIAHAEDCNTALIGSWHGKDPGLGAEFLVTHTKDGKFQLMYKAKDVDYNGTSTGRWGCSNGLFVSWTQVVAGKTVDPKEWENHDVYDTQSLTRTEWVFQDIRTGRTYKVRRVNSDFHL